MQREVWCLDFKIKGRGFLEVPATVTEYCWAKTAQASVSELWAIMRAEVSRQIRTRVQCFNLNRGE